MALFNRPTNDQLIELSSSDELLEPRNPLERLRSEPSMLLELRLLPDELEPDEPDNPLDRLLLPLALREESLVFGVLELPELREPEAPIEPPWLEPPDWLEPL